MTDQTDAISSVATRVYAVLGITNMPDLSEAAFTYNVILATPYFADQLRLCCEAMQYGADQSVSCV